MPDRKFIDDCLRAHNVYRQKHQVLPLKHNRKLTDISQKWADHLASRNIFGHSSNQLNGEKLGENIAMKWTSSRDDFTGQQVTDEWYSEIKFYNYSGHNNISKTGHFTQVVWKGSVDIGVGKAQARDGKWLVVANYLPAGNFLGKFNDNVLRPSGKADIPKPNSGFKTSNSDIGKKERTKPTPTPWEKTQAENVAPPGGGNRLKTTIRPGDHIEIPISIHKGGKPSIHVENATVTVTPRMDRSIWEGKKTVAWRERQDEETFRSTCTVIPSEHPGTSSKIETKPLSMFGDRSVFSNVKKSPWGSSHTTETTRREIRHDGMTTTVIRKTVITQSGQSNYSSRESVQTVSSSGAPKNEVDIVKDRTPNEPTASPSKLSKFFGRLGISKKQRR